MLEVDPSLKHIVVKCILLPSHVGTRQAEGAAQPFYEKLIVGSLRSAGRTRGGD